MPEYKKDRVEFLGKSLICILVKNFMSAYSSGITELFSIYPVFPSAISTNKMFPCMAEVSNSSNILTLEPLFRHISGVLPENGESSLSV